MENGEILDSQISSTSPTDEDYTTSLGRLHLNAVVWSADTKDGSQWLQVDLRNKNIRVTGVATQGRNGRYSHWVTKYRLQYSNDGLKFQFYKDPGHTKVKVCAKSTELITLNVRVLFFFLSNTNPKRYNSFSWYFWGRITLQFSVPKSLLSIDKRYPSITAEGLVKKRSCLIAVA